MNCRTFKQILKILRHNLMCVGPDMTWIGSILGHHCYYYQLLDQMTQEKIIITTKWLVDSFHIMRNELNHPLTTECDFKMVMMIIMEKVLHFQLAILVEWCNVK